VIQVYRALKEEVEQQVLLAHKDQMAPKAMLEI
jgi:hypothetical protein